MKTAKLPKATRKINAECHPDRADAKAANMRYYARRFCLLDVSSKTDR